MFHRVSVTGTLISLGRAKKLLTLKLRLARFGSHTETRVDTMRTKTLLLTAALSAAGVVGSAAADVFSANIVGYVTKDLSAGFNLIANPLNSSNTVADLFADLGFGSIVYKYNGTGFDSSSRTPAGWSDPDMTIAPGEGVFVSVGAATSVTFVGEVMTGDLSNGWASGGFKIVSSQVPQEGLLEADLGYTAGFGDIVYKFVDGAYQSHNRTPAGWGNGEPTIGVGEAFWLTTTGAGSWDRTFTVDN